ncbi:MAG TPA: hypothetical protein VGO58_00135 [Chitinophagaceae bacterium]|jgi:hypothetical protein|nr:hypothetical protein [Chitinophagaceae bacterium]
MLEIIALVLLCGQMGKLATRKGQKPGAWKVYTVLAWIGGEVLGIIIAVVAFHSEDYLSMLPMALLGAVGGYLIVRAILSKMPDKPEEGFEFENKTGDQ